MLPLDGVEIEIKRAIKVVTPSADIRHRIIPGELPLVGRSCDALASLLKHLDTTLRTSTRGTIFAAA